MKINTGIKKQGRGLRRKLNRKTVSERRKGKLKITLKKFAGNPIIEPSELHPWETKATFNPAALYARGRVHLIYRAIGDNDISVLGYASSTDGFVIDEKLAEPAFIPQNHLQRRRAASARQTPRVSLYSSGGGWHGGCEDPRLTLLDDVIYILYTAFDGWGSIRIALTSISLDDFTSKRWNWKKPVLISPPGEIHKNWVLFPEKINGKYAILHSISPDILVDYVDNLNEFDGSKYIDSSYRNGGLRKNRWDTWLRGTGPPPIKTSCGWLLMYHAIDERDPGRYKLGVMILDSNDPTKILYRSVQPILEPDKDYENNGFKAGVVYACGAVVLNNKLLIYYGGSDKVVCVASAHLDEFLEELISTGTPKLKRISKMKIKK